MWFRNLSCFRLETEIAYDPEALHQSLQGRPLRPCGALDLSTQGWLSPYGEAGMPLVHGANGAMLVCAATQEKLLPAGIVREEVQRRQKALEADQARPLGRREIAELRDSVTTEMLPKALVRTKRVYAYIDTRNKYLVIDTATAKQAELVMSLLREGLGSLALVPLRAKKAPQDVLTHWFQQQQADLPDFELGVDCDLKDPLQEKGAIRIRGYELTADEVKAHLQAGRLVQRLALEWNERVGFVLDEELVIRRLKFLDLVQEAREEIETEGDAERLDADFSILSAEVAQLIPRVLAALGGPEEKPSA